MNCELRVLSASCGFGRRQLTTWGGRRTSLGCYTWPLRCTRPPSRASRHRLYRYVGASPNRLRSRDLRVLLFCCHASCVAVASRNDCPHSVWQCSRVSCYLMTLCRVNYMHLPLVHSGLCNWRHSSCVRRRQSSGSAATNIQREAAHNLALIYKRSGAYSLARDLLRKHFAV